MHTGGAMLKRASISFRLIGMILLLLTITCVALATINFTFSQRVLEKEIKTRTLPALASEVVSEVDRQIAAPATTLTALARHPLLQDWILQGEDPAKIPLIFQTGRNMIAVYGVGGVNVVLRDSLNFYELSGNVETVKKVDPAIDGWFFAFEKSGDPLWLNVHGPTDPQYANMAFINARIDHNGRFLGIVSVAMQIQELSQRLYSMRIGEKGSTFLVRRNGEIMLHPDSRLNGTSVRELPGFRDHATVALQERSSSFVTRNADGERIIIATQQLPVLNAVVFTVANQSEQLQEFDAILFYSVTASLIVLILGIALALLFVRTITRPLNQIIQYAGDVAAERKVPAPSLDAGSEIGELLTSVNTMVDSIAQRVREAQEKSAEARKQTELANAALEDSRRSERQVGDLIAAMLHASKEAESIAEEVAMASQKCVRELKRIGGQVLDNDQRVQGVAQTMRNMHQQVDSMITSAAIAQESAVTARASADKGRQTLTQAVGAIDTVNARTDALRAELERLGEKANAIGAILTVINDIADQTNLLALNAAIEAARAGEAGRGFAVVADEVRKLAEKTMQATGDVARNIKEIQSAAKDSIGGMTQTFESVRGATERSHEAGEELTAIVASVDASAMRVEDMAGVARQQNDTAQTITADVSRSSEVTSMLIADMEKMSDSMQSLAVRADDLRGLVEELIRSGAKK